MMLLTPKYPSTIYHSIFNQVRPGHYSLKITRTTPSRKTQLTIYSSRNPTPKLPTTLLLKPLYKRHNFTPPIRPRHTLFMQRAPHNHTLDIPKHAPHHALQLFRLLHRNNLIPLRPHHQNPRLHPTHRLHRLPHIPRIPQKWRQIPIRQPPLRIQHTQHIRHAHERGFQD